MEHIINNPHAMTAARAGLALCDQALLSDILTTPGLNHSLRRTFDSSTAFATSLRTRPHSDPNNDPTPAA